MEDKIILIIEDEPFLKKVLSEELANAGFTIFQAGDGEEGLKIAMQEHPDLILLDIVLPKMDGFIMLEKLRKDSWGKMAKVIVLTNLNDEKYIMQSFRSEVFDYFVKTNVRISDLIQKIKAKLKYGNKIGN